MKLMDRIAQCVFTADSAAGCLSPWIGPFMAVVAATLLFVLLDLLKNGASARISQLAGSVINHFQMRRVARSLRNRPPAQVLVIIANLSQDLGRDAERRIDDSISTRLQKFLYKQHTDVAVRQIDLRTIRPKEDAQSPRVRRRAEAWLNRTGATFLVWGYHRGGQAEISVRLFACRQTSAGIEHLPHRECNLAASGSFDEFIEDLIANWLAHEISPPKVSATRLADDALSMAHALTSKLSVQARTRVDPSTFAAINRDLTELTNAGASRGLFLKDWSAAYDQAMNAYKSVATLDQAGRAQSALELAKLARPIVWAEGENGKIDFAARAIDEAIGYFRRMHNLSELHDALVSKCMLAHHWKPLFPGEKYASWEAKEEVLRLGEISGLKWSDDQRLDRLRISLIWPKSHIGSLFGLSMSNMDWRNASWDKANVKLADVDMASVISVALSNRYPANDKADTILAEFDRSFLFLEYAQSQVPSYRRVIHLMIDLQRVKQLSEVSLELGIYSDHEARTFRGKSSSTLGKEARDGFRLIETEISKIGGERLLFNTMSANAKALSSGGATFEEMMEAIALNKKQESVTHLYQNSDRISRAVIYNNLCNRFNLPEMARIAILETESISRDLDSFGAYVRSYSHYALSRQIFRGRDKIGPTAKNDAIVLLGDAYKLLDTAGSLSPSNSELNMIRTLRKSLDALRGEIAVD